MIALQLHQLHESLKAVFQEVNGFEVVRDYGDPDREYQALTERAALLDLSFRSRLCLTGADRVQFLNGQVTNNVKDLSTGQGCYAALINAKGRMQSDLNIYRLNDELLLDFEPGWQQSVRERLEKYIIIEDVQIVDVSDQYGLLSLQGPQSPEILAQLHPDLEPPKKEMSLSTLHHPALGEIYVMNRPRLERVGYDLFVPMGLLEKAARDLLAAGVTGVGWQALERRRIELGIPRFGADMDETTLPPEAKLEARAISYTKGCYIGQEVIARIRNYGQAAKTLRGFLLPANLNASPTKGDKVFTEGKEVGFLTSSAYSETLGRWAALGYLRREITSNQPELYVAVGEDKVPIKLTDLPLAPLKLCESIE